MKIEDLTGQRYGMLTVLSMVNERRNGKIYWRCLCDCGNIVERSSCYLKSGKGNSCGCQHYLRISKSQTRHGMSGTRLYRVWEAMKRRCDNPKTERYPHYGGRGIRYCKEWKTFDGFYAWAKISGYREGLSIERIDVNGNYEPANCRWITLHEQGYNKTDSRRVLYNGRNITVAEFAQEIGVPYHRIYQELTRLHWTPEQCAAHANGGAI